ncbi:NIPSNAP family protein [Paenibacillus illinoisensis]|uniref:NIPSNAP family protein n=1 Tax=Paenibacillus illinoisensis TaxID=59845 RepID=UPI003CF39164
MFYRRKYYVVNNEFVDIFNRHFIETNLPNQLKNGARLVGRWMVRHSEKTTEIFAIWEYDSIEKYEEIETNIRSDKEHYKKIIEWYELHGGRDHIAKEYIYEVKNEELISTLSDGKGQFRTIL